MLSEFQDVLFTCKRNLTVLNEDISSAIISDDKGMLCIFQIMVKHSLRQVRRVKRDVIFLIENGERYVLDAGE